MMKRYLKNIIWTLLLSTSLGLGLTSSVYALPGDLKWSAPTYGNIGSSVAINPVYNGLYVGSANHYVYAYSYAGDYQWRFKTEGYVGSSPTVSADGETIFVGSYDGNVYALNAVTGEEIWRFSTAGEIYSSPALTNNGVLYIGSGDSQVYSIDAATGVERWQYDAGFPVLASPSVGADGTVYVGTADGYLHALSDSASDAGRVLWSHQISTVAGAMSASVVDNDRLYIGTFSNELFAIDLDVNAEPREIWSVNLGGRIASSPAIDSAGMIYVGAYDTGILYSIEPVAGNIVDSYPTDSLIYSSPAVASDGSVYVGTFDGNLHALTSTLGSFSPKRTYPLDSAVVASPTLGSDGTVFIVSKESSLYAYEEVAGLSDSSWPMFGADYTHSRMIPNLLPTASAGLDQSVDEQTSVILNGSGTDSSGAPTTIYTWSQKDGPLVSLDTSVVAAPSFMAPVLTEVATFTFELVVTDNEGRNSPADEVVITAKPVNPLPTADAGLDRGVNEQTPVTLSGGGTDDGSIVGYAWTPAGMLDDVSVANPTFTAPAVTVATDFIFALMVTDDEGGESQVADEVVITVYPVNPLPTADAGIDQSIKENSLVSLSGGGADDGSIIGYVWTQAGSPVVTLNDHTLASPTFTAPAVATATNLTFELMVTDNEGGVSLEADSVVITVNPNVIPVANAGPDQTADEGTLHSLNGNLSDDSDGTITTYAWIQTAGSDVSLTGANTATPSFTVPAGVYVTFDLVVTDNDGAQSLADSVTITINALPQPNQPPIAYSDNISTIEGSAVTANIIANDYDADQDVLFIATVDTASNNGGTIVNNGDDTITYTPPADFWGTDMFSYQVTDGEATVVGDVIVAILPVNGTEIRINAGGNEVIDSLGRTWAADYGFNTTGIAAGIANPIAGKESANDAYIYQTERSTNWDLSTISYSYAVPNGDYRVSLHFADTYFWLNGQRVFNVSIEGLPLINNLDIISEVSYNAPLIEHFDVLVSDGIINIDFMPISEIPVINAIEIIAKGISKSSIPGTIQAEDYSAGENGVAYNDIWSGNDGSIYRRDDVDIGVTNDIDGGYKVGWTQDNEWLNYDVFVAETGFYNIDIRASNPSVDWYWGRMKLELDGADLTSLLIAPLTAGSDMFDESSVRKVPLTAGAHTLKLLINQGGIDVNWLRFTKYNSFDIPGRIEAEDYGHDGAEVSYSDSSIGNYAGWYRNDDVDVDITSDVGGGYKVAWIAGNEWLKYDATITASGTYDVEFRVSKGDVGDAVFHLERDGIDITGPITVNGSGTYDWNMFDTITVNNVNLEEGTASFRIVIDQASLDINWMQFVLISPN